MLRHRARQRARYQPVAVPKKPARRRSPVGERFGQLVTIEALGGSASAVLCKCDCGNEKVARRSNLRAGLTTTCADRERHPDPRRKPDRKHKPRARAKLRQLTRAERLAVFEGDGWICQLCTEPIPAGLAWPHPLYPSIDHVVPLAAGGAHDASNWQAAHFRCNSLAQAKGYRAA